MRPEILLSAADVLLQGLTPGVDAPIVSTGMQDLVTICSYDVERQNQACEDDEADSSAPYLCELVDLLHILVDGGIFACYYIRLLH